MRPYRVVCSMPARARGTLAGVACDPAAPRRARAAPAKGAARGRMRFRRFGMLLTLMRFVCYLITGWMCAHVPRLRKVVADYERCRA